MRISIKIRLQNLDHTSASKSWPNFDLKSWTKLRSQFFTNLQLRQSAKDSHSWAVSSTPFAQLYPCLLNFSRHSHLWENDFYAVGPWKLINWRAPSGLKLHCNKCPVCIVNTNSKASKSINSYQILVLYKFFLCFCPSVFVKVINAFNRWECVSPKPYLN